MAKNQRTTRYPWLPLCLAAAVFVSLCGAWALAQEQQEESEATWRAMPPVEWLRLSDSLWRIEDGTVAYLVRRGGKALMINTGAGRALRDLAPAEVTAVEGVLVTHHLRPVTQGLGRAVHRGAWIAAPASEARLLAEAETFWRETALRDVYVFKPDLATPVHNLPVTKTLVGGKTFTWQDLNFEVIETPGPTAGAISLVAKIDELTVAFTGELIVGDGQLPNYWNMQYRYGDSGLPGLRATRASLREVMKRQPALLLPARGSVIADPAGTVERLEKRIAALEKLLDAKPLGRGIRNNDHPLPHLYWQRGSYLMVGDDGHALLVGYPGLDLRGWGGPEWLGKLRRKGVFNALDGVVLLGYQDDHVAGAPGLASTFGCPIYTSSEVAQALRTDLPDPFSLLRAGQFDARIQPSVVSTGDGANAEDLLGGHRVRFVPLGGHSYHQLAMLVELDGEQVLFTGDTIAPTEPLTGDLNSLCRIERPGYGYADAAAWLQKLRPTMAATNHHGLIELNAERIEGFAAWARALEPAFTALLATRNYREGLDPFARHAVAPFHLVMDKPANKNFRIIAHNEKRGPLAVQYRFLLPEGWKLQTRSRDDPNAYEDTLNTVRVRRDDVTTWTLDLRLIPPPDLAPGRTLIPVDIVDNGDYLGQILHLVVDCAFTPPEPWRPASGLTPYDFSSERYRNFAWLPPRRGGQRVLWRGW